MNVNIQSLKFDADQKLVDFVQEKVGKMERFVDHVVGVEVTMRIDKDNARGNKVTMIRLEVPGNDLIAEYQSKTFEESVDLCIDALKKQIDKHKEKLSPQR